MLHNQESKSKGLKQKLTHYFSRCNDQDRRCCQAAKSKGRLNRFGLPFMTMNRLFVSRLFYG